jgi:uncharacterized protein (TIGR02757 family)
VSSLPFHLLKEFLEEKYDLYNRPQFIDSDPIQIPHSFSIPEDIEIAGFLAATIAWGQRKSIITNARRLMDRMGNAPFEFVMNSNTDQIGRIDGFVHRTFNSGDCAYFIKSLRNIYLNHNGLKCFFEESFAQNGEISNVLSEFRTLFFEISVNPHAGKHVSDVGKGSSGKRLNMYLRWLVRNDQRGVDLGLWKKIPASALYLPLDLHTGNVARKLGILQRNQNDWKAVAEVTSALRKLDASDPVKYDFALFGLGIFEKF